MTRAAAFALFLCLGCSPSPVPRLVPVGFSDTANGLRLEVGGVRVGDPEIAAVAALGDSGRAGLVGLHEAMIELPGGARARVRYTAREGRVDGLFLSLDGTPAALMRSRIALARSAMRAGATCGPDGCAVRGGAVGSAAMRVESVLAWPALVDVRDAPPAAGHARRPPATASRRGQ